MRSKIDKLITIGNAIGQNVAYVQGGGGNVSLKTSQMYMYVKASGKFLADIEDEKSFVPVNWARIRDLVGECKTEAEYGRLLADSTLKHSLSLRPSIETGFHAILDRCTLHTHSVWANILTCSLDGEAQIQRLFPHAIWIPYATPGLALTKAMVKRLDGAKHVTVFLQNHGVIVSGPDIDTVEAMHSSITEIIRNAYPNLSDFDEKINNVTKNQTNGLLFPDQAVYNADQHLARSRAGRETMRACTFIESQMKQAGLTVNYIDEAERDVLLNMDSEKYRQRLIET